MQCAEYLSILNILIAFLGIMFVLVTIYEYWRLKRLRDDFARMKQELRDEHFRAEKAGQRVMASYSEKDVDRKIDLLQEAVAIHPGVFNGYNALGWAWVEKDEIFRAVEAFNKAIEQHPREKAGFLDLAHVYLKQGKSALALETLEKAVAVDPTSKKDLQNNPLFSTLSGDARYKALMES